MKRLVTVFVLPYLCLFLLAAFIWSITPPILQWHLFLLVFCGILLIAWTEWHEPR